MSEDAKKALESAISKIGKGYGDLLKVAERYGHEIEPEQYHKARIFLDRTLGKIWDNIDVVRDVATATSGSFTLDSVDLLPLETLGKPEVKMVSVAPTDPRDGRALAQQIGGRLTKSARANMELERSVKTDSAPENESSGMDADDDVDFIDD